MRQFRDVLRDFWCARLNVSALKKKCYSTLKEIIKFVRKYENLYFKGTTIKRDMCSNFFMQRLLSNTKSPRICVEK